MLCGAGIHFGSRLLRPFFALNLASFPVAHASSFFSHFHRVSGGLGSWKSSPSLFASRHHSGAIIAITPFHSILDSFWHHTLRTNVLSPRVTWSQSTWVRASRRKVGRSSGGTYCPLSSARPLSVRLSFFHRPRPLSDDSGGVGGDEVTHSNANAARGVVVSLGRTNADGRSGRSVARSLIRRHAAGRKWWKLGIWRTSTRDDRSIDCRYLLVIHSLVASGTAAEAD